MRIGVPAEIKVHEYRVGLTPGSVAELTAAGHEVLVQTRAGAGIGFMDRDYERAGAKIAPDAATVFRNCGADREGQGTAAASSIRCCGPARSCSLICTSRPIVRRPMR